MNRCLLLLVLLLPTGLMAQDSLFNSTETVVAQKPVKIFNSQKAINANTTEVVGKGKMEFKVMHNFGDIGGNFGGLKNFYGLDNATDIRISFEIGLGERFDLTFARSKGAQQQQKLWEMDIKYQLARQMENDPRHPLSIAFFANAVIAGNKASALNNQDHSFRSLSDRTSNVFQLIIARKAGKVSLQLNPTLVTRGYAISYDQKTIFALGGALKVPITRSLNLVVDYFHPFRTQASKDSFAAITPNPVKFFDPLGIGFEIVTPGHVFHMNFTNATELTENRFIPRTTSSWGKGQFRWGFTIARKFTIFRVKKKLPTE
jgi:hypothetical protein